jgi:hypothetical protein
VHLAFDASGGVTTVRELGDRTYLSLRLRGSLGPGGEVGLPTIVASAIHRIHAVFARGTPIR